MQNLSAKDFFKKCIYNCETQNQLWCSQIADGHDNFCSCNQPFAHLLASIFPPGHTDRKLTIQQILDRDYRALCLSGGEEETKIGMAEDLDIGTSAAGLKEEKEEDYIEDKDLEELIAAGEDAATR